MKTLDILFLIAWICAGEGVASGEGLCGLPVDYVVARNEPLVEDTAIYFFNLTEEVKIKSGGEGYFRIENNTVYAERNISLDNDQTLCDTGRIVRMKIECAVGVSDFYISVKPVNNYQPKFSADVVNTTVREAMPNSTFVFDVGRGNPATDEDCPETLHYSANSTKDIRFSFSNTILTQRSFDYEAGDRQFSMTVTVRDTPQNDVQHEASFIFLLYVEDVDDEKPIFRNYSYSLTVLEETTTEAGVWLDAIPKVEAYDQDLGINQSVQYSIAGASVPNVPDPEVGINLIDGRLMVNGTLDRETTASYIIILKVEQTDNNLQSATSTLTLHVADINDNRPLFEPLTYSVSIQEHTSPGTNVIRVSATDRDEGNNSAFIYKLVTPLDVFKIDPITGYIQVENATALDRETKATFTINVTTVENATIQGYNCTASCYAIITVTLIDINDNQPVFDQEAYVFSSDNTLNMIIGQVNATDADIGENGRIEYFILPPTVEFTVNKTTGSITQITHVTGEHQMLLRACDAGEARRCTSVIITVSIPEHAVTSVNVTANVTENVAVDTPVYIIPDTYSGYQLKLQESKTFQLKTTTYPGLLVTNADIDRENISRYSVVIDVILANTVNGTITIDIRVLDQNDNAPIFNNSYQFDIKDDAKSGDVIGTVAAYDFDEGPNGQVAFSIQGIQSSYQFEIHSDSGQIKLKKVPDLTQEYIEVVVVAADNGEVPLRNTTAVKVYVGRKDGTVRFVAPAGKDDVETDEDELISKMSEILQVTVAFDEIRSITAPYGPSCAIYLTASHRVTRAATGSKVAEDDLRSRVEDNQEPLLQLFSKYQRTSGNQNPVTLPVIILIAVLAAVILAFIVTVAVLCRRNNGFRRQARLVDHLSIQGTIYDTQVVTVDVEDEASEHSRTGSLTTQQLLGESQPNGDAIGVLNPGFNSSDSSHGDENQDTVTQFTHVEDDQDDQVVVEEVLMDFTAENNPEQETGETNPATDYLTAVLEDVDASNHDYVNAVVVEDTVPKADYVNVILPGEEAEAQTSDSIQFENEPTYAVVNKQRSEVDAEDSQQSEDLPAPPVDLEDVHVNAAVEEEEEEEDDLPPPPPTPPRVRAKASEEEEELEESPEEPEPDYAKKVRFSEVKEQMIPDPEIVNGEVEGAETDDEDPTIRTGRPFETIQNPSEDISDDGTFIMTSL